MDAVTQIVGGVVVAVVTVTGSWLAARTSARSAQRSAEGL